MDCAKVGQLILQLRTEKNMTQQELADQLGISNKTVSKWERGRGAPDLTLWEDLSAVLGADVLKLLRGELAPNRRDIGRMDRVRFYVCPNCGNILTATGSASMACCGRRLAPLVPAPGGDGHEIKAERMDGRYFISFRHEMSKSHFISFAAYVYDDELWFRRLYPEQSAAFELPDLRAGGSVYLYCTEHGLFKYPKVLQHI